MEKKSVVEFKFKAAEKFVRNYPRSKWKKIIKDFCDDLGYYIDCHEQAGKHFDRQGVYIVYDRYTIVLLRKEQGTWYIIKVMKVGRAVGYQPVYAWKLVKIGYRIVAVEFLASWHIVRAVSPT